MPDSNDISAFLNNAASIAAILGAAATIIGLLIQLMRSDFDIITSSGKISTNNIPESNTAFIQAANSYNISIRAAALAKKTVGFRLKPYVRAMLLVLVFYFFMSLCAIGASLASNIDIIICFIFLFVICIILVAMTLPLLFFDTYSLSDVKKKWRERKARLNSQKNGYTISLSGFKNTLSIPSQKYIVYDCRLKRDRVENPIPYTLSEESISIKKLARQDDDVMIFVFSDFGKESFELVKKVREKGHKNTFDLGGIKGYSHLYDKTIRTQVYCDHAPVSLPQRLT